MEEQPKIVVCRKCGGPHFTIKCGKEKVKVEEKVQETTEPVKKVYTEFREERRPYKNDDSFREKKFFKTTYRVKLSELPKDMTEEELMYMTADWGHIVRLRVINYDDNTVAFIDFGHEEEATYFIEAVDKTPLENLMITAIRVDSKPMY
jgi:RNA recognition motif-containing protein